MSEPKASPAAPSGQLYVVETAKSSLEQWSAKCSKTPLPGGRLCKFGPQTYAFLVDGDMADPSKFRAMFDGLERLHVEMVGRGGVGFLRRPVDELPPGPKNLDKEDGPEGFVHHGNDWTSLGRNIPRGTPSDDTRLAPYWEAQRPTVLGAV